MTQVEFLFDVGSPNAYLCHQVIPAIEARTAARFTYVPVLLGGIFKATGNRSPAEAFSGIRNKLEYEELERQRFVRKHGITGFAITPYFPVNTLGLMRGAVAARRLGVFERYVEVAFHHMWVDHRKLDDAEILLATLNRAGLDGSALMAAAQDPTVKQELAETTRQAVERGVFGAPTFFVNGEIYFGKDRLGEVEAAIRAAAA